MSGFRFIRYLADYDVARVVLSRPPLNIMSVEMMREMAAALDEAAGRPGLKALVLSGDGKAFSASPARWRCRSPARSSTPPRPRACRCCA